MVSPDGQTTVGFSSEQIHIFTKSGHTILKPKGWSPAAAFSADGKTLYVSEGDEGEIAEYDTTTWKRQSKDIALNPGKDKDA